MLIKMLRHGTGSAARAARDVLDEKDHKNIVRPHVEVLCGDPHLFAKIADSSPFKHKYTSAVIAFAEEDRPTDVEIKDVLKQFEALAFSGLEPDQYHLTAVLHQEPSGSKHVHILVPRLELRSGKAMNIAPPGKFQKHFHSLQDKLNFEYGWADPNDPDRARFTKKGYELYLQSGLKKVGKDRENYKQYIENLYTKLLSMSLKQLEKKHVHVIPSELLVRNREDFIRFVLHNKLASEVVKIREKQFSLIPPFGKKAIYFQGEIYERQFSIEKCSGSIRQRINALEQVRSADFELGTNEQRAFNQISKYTRTPHSQFRDRAEQALHGARQARATYNKKRYASVTTSEERDPDTDQRIEFKSSRVEAQHQQDSIDAVIVSQRNQYDDAGTHSAVQSAVTANDRQPSKSLQHADSEQYAEYQAYTTKPKEAVAAASGAIVNSDDYIQSEIIRENVNNDGSWNMAAEYFSHITCQLLSDSANFDQIRYRDSDGRQWQSLSSNHLSEMDRLQYSEFKQKNDSSESKYQANFSVQSGEISDERTTFNYPAEQRQRHTADDSRFTRTNEFSFDTIIAEYYARLARKRREDEKKAQRDRELRAEQQRRYEQDLENIRLQQSIRIESRGDGTISEYWINDQNVKFEAGKITTIGATADIAESARTTATRAEHAMYYSNQRSTEISYALDRALRYVDDTGRNNQRIADETATPDYSRQQDDAELYAEYERFKQNMRRLREQADADQEYTATMQQQHQFDRERAAEFAETIQRLAKLIEELVRLIISMIVALFGQHYHIQQQPRSDQNQQLTLKPNFEP